MNKITTILISTIILAFLVVFFFIKGKEKVIIIQESTILEKIEEQTPYTKKYLLIFNVTLHNPRLNMTQGSDKIGVGIDLGMNIKINDREKNLTGSIDIKSGLIYSDEEGAFYLSDLEIEKLDLKGIPSKYSKRVDALLEKAIASYLSDHPIYSLDQTDIKQLAAKIALKSVIIEGENVMVTLGI